MTLLSQQTDDELDKAYEYTEQELVRTIHEFNSFDYWSEAEYESYEHEIRLMREFLQEILDEFTRRDLLKGDHNGNQRNIDHGT